MLYAIIGKQVYNNKVSKFRLLNMDTNTYEDINVDDLEKYKNEEFSNGEYSEDFPYHFNFYFQSVYDLPIFYRTGNVNTYYYKVIINTYEDNKQIKVIVSNIVGSTVTVSDNSKGLYSFLKLHIHNLILATPSGIYGFCYNLDGTVSNFLVNPKYLFMLSEMAINNKFCYTVYYKNVPCYYFNCTDKKNILLGAVSGLNKYQIVGINEKSYAKRSVYFVDAQKDADSYNTLCSCTHFFSLSSKVESVLGMNSVGCLLGIDGVTFIGPTLKLNNGMINDVKDRLMCTNPDMAKKIDEGLQLSNSNEVIKLNLLDFSIPEGVVTVCKQSLYMKYSSDTMDRKRQYNLDTIVIPETVTSFDNESFVKASSSLLMDKMSKVTCIVENPDIYNNVLLSVFFAKLPFKCISTEGYVTPSLKRLKQVYTSSLLKTLKTENFSMKTIKCSDKNRTKIECSEYLKGLKDYDIVSSQEYIDKGISSNDSYAVFEFEVLSEILPELREEYSKYKDLYTELNALVKEVDKGNNESVKRVGIKLNTFISNSKEYLRFIQSFNIKHGDAKLFNQIVSGFKSFIIYGNVLKSELLK